MKRETRPKTLFDLYDGDSFPRSYSLVSTCSVISFTSPRSMSLADWLVPPVAPSDDYNEFLKWKANQKKEKEFEDKPLELPKRLITVE